MTGAGLDGRAHVGQRLDVIIARVGVDAEQEPLLHVPAGLGVAGDLAGLSPGGEVAARHAVGILKANLEDMNATGRVLQDLGGDLGELAVSAGKVMMDGNLLQSAVIAPDSYATFQAEMASVIGPSGLGAHALSVTAAGLFMRSASRAYNDLDEAMAGLASFGQWMQGFRLPVEAGSRTMPHRWGENTVDVFRLYREGLFTDPEQWLVEHPDRVESLVASAPGFVALLGLAGYGARLGPFLGQLPNGGAPFNVDQGAEILAGFYDQTYTLEKLETVRGQRPPGSLDGALRRLQEVNDESGQFEVEVTGSQVTIYLPGTEEFDAPWDESGLVRNMGTNLAAVAGETNGYEEAVLRALRGIKDLPEGAEVTMVSHSQGGIVAARLAERITQGEAGDYAVSHVVTAGSPVDHIRVPDEVQMVSLVNEYDIVTRLDGTAYGDRANHTTIVAHMQTGGVKANHNLKNVYTPMAAAMEASTQPEVKSALEGLTFGTGESTVHRYGMSRQ
jgi:hypothetical protein